MESVLIDLVPVGWAVASLDELATVNPAKLDATYGPDDVVTFLPMSAVEAESNLVNFGETRTWQQVQSGYTKFQAGDVIIAKITPCMENGKAAVVPHACPPIAAGSTEFHVVRPFEGVDAGYLFYYVVQKSFRGQAEAHMSGAVGQRRVPASFLREARIPLAPSVEQNRILAAVDEEFARLEAAVRSLEAAKRKLTAFRASALQAAVEGRLVPTEAELSRRHKEATGDDRPFETGAELLTRILEERRARWEAEQVNKFRQDLRKKLGYNPPKLGTALYDFEDRHGARVAGEVGRFEHDPTWKRKYKPPTPPDTANLPDLPEGWTWASVDQLAEVGTGATPLRTNKRYYTGGHIPWITSGAVNDESVSRCDEMITDAAIAETNCKVFPRGSFLVAMYGEGKTRGKVARLEIDAATNQALAILVFEGLAATTEGYVRTVFQKSYLDLRREASGGVQPNLNLSTIRQTLVPLPPLAEMVRISYALRQRLGSERELATGLDRTAEMARGLRQAILKAAFEGKLVPQDPTDEPASALLDRIRAERESERLHSKPFKANRKRRFLGTK